MNEKSVAVFFLLAEEWRMIKVFDLKMNCVSGHQKKEVDIEIATQLEVTCRQACFADLCVQDIIHLNLNFDLQWISPVSERNKGSKVTWTSQGSMASNLWWTISESRCHIVMLI